MSALGREFQTILNRFVVTPISVDGIVGPQTLSAFRSLDPVRQKDVLISLPEATALLGGGKWVSESVVRALASKYESFYGLPPGYIYHLVTLEALSRIDSGVTYFDASSTHGSFVGLAQMGVGAWTDALAYDERHAGFMQGAGYASASNPTIALAAAAAYAKVNEGYARHLGYKGDFTSAILYSMHNQGAGVIRHLLTGDTHLVGSQSAAAQHVINVASLEVRNLRG